MAVEVQAWCRKYLPCALKRLDFGLVGTRGWARDDGILSRLQVADTRVWRDMMYVSGIYAWRVVAAPDPDQVKEALECLAVKPFEVSPALGNWAALWQQVEVEKPLESLQGDAGHVGRKVSREAWAGGNARRTGSRSCVSGWRPLASPLESSVMSESLRRDGL